MKRPVAQPRAALTAQASWMSPAPVWTMMIRTDRERRQERKVAAPHQTFWISRRMLWVQGLYFAITGIWPLIDLASFQAVTGRKTDLWLVQTVGALLTVIGMSFCIAGSRYVVGAGTYFLAVASALALMLVDVVFTTEGTISRIYLLDAAAELLLLIGWGTLAILAFRSRHPRHPRRHLALALR